MIRHWGPKLPGKMKKRRSRGAEGRRPASIRPVPEKLLARWIGHGRFRHLFPTMVSANTELAYNSKIEGEVIVTRADAVINWIRSTSMGPMPMGLACCAIELMAAGASRFDIARFGAEVM